MLLTVVSAAARYMVKVLPLIGVVRVGSVLKHSYIFWKVVSASGIHLKWLLFKHFCMIAMKDLSNFLGRACP